MQVLSLETVDSTNLYAKNNIGELSNCTVIHALRQTSGRGRFTRKWVDLGDGNLFLSFVLKPETKFSSSFPNITQYLSVVLCKVLETFGVEPQIKWPNDVLVNGKKIAGILCEAVNEGGCFKGLVLGIGVNLNAFDCDLNLVSDKVITALNLEISNSVDVYAFRNKLMSEFSQNYEKFLEMGFEFIKEDYISKLVVLNKDISVQVLNDVKTGFVKGVTNTGELVLENQEKEFVLTIGDIL